MALIKTELAPGRIRNRSLKDYSGLKMGRLEVLSLHERDVKWSNHLWLCRCECGKEKPIGIKSITSGNTQSCGCLFSDRMVERNTSHGKSDVAAYRSWKDMRARCNNPSDSDYKDYGGRGILVCDRWSDFAVFFSDMGDRPKGHTLDRIEVNGNYEPSNCRWATAKVQANNKRSNHAVESDGVTKNLQQWCDEFGIDPAKARYRLKQGWAPEKVFSKEDFRK